MNVLDAESKEIHQSLFFEPGYARGLCKGKWKYIAVRYPQYAVNMSLPERARVLKAYNEDRLSMDMEIVNTDPAQPFSHLSVISGGGHAEFESTGAYPGYYDTDQLYDLYKDPAYSVHTL